MSEVYSYMAIVFKFFNDFFLGDDEEQEHDVMLHKWLFTAVHSQQIGGITSEW